MYRFVRFLAFMVCFSRRGNMSIDLHCHTKISDGSLGVEELLALAKRRGITGLAITDHDAIAGSTRATIIGKRIGIDVIHGVEFSAYDNERGRKVHILGYMCDCPDRLEGLCRRLNVARRTAATEMIRKVLRYYPIIPDSIARCASGSTAIYKQHIMHALIDAGYADSFYGEVYEKLFNSKTGCAYVPIEYVDVREAIDLIHSAGGLAILAHPYAYNSIDLMEELTQENRLDGIEAWRNRHTPEQIAQLTDFAEQHNLCTTAGSDFHGMYSAVARPLGTQGAEDTIQKLRAYKARKYRD